MASELGHSLREARIRRGVDLSEVEQVTRIRVKYLRAMEEDRWELLPAAAYARGFLRTYASFIGLDGEALAREYERRYQPAEEGPPHQEPPARTARAIERPRMRPSGRTAAVLAAVLLVGLVVVLGVTGDSGTGDGSAGGGSGAGAREGRASPGTAPTEGRRSPPGPASLRVTATGTVWVCLIDDRGRALVNGLTLGAGEARGPYRAGAFKVTFGNGEVGMEVDGEPVTVPNVAQPLGYEISRQGVRQLAPTARPTCT